MRHKSDVTTLFPQFKNLVEKYFQLPVVSLYSDNGGEYIALKPYLQQHGISHFTTPPHTPEHNGVAERRHRHIVETGRALLHHASLPVNLWSFAFQTATYLINRLPTSILSNSSPFEVLHRHSPNYQKLRVFGCRCYPWLRPYTTSKLQPRSVPCVFVGYSDSQFAYKCFDPQAKRLYISRHVTFVEHDLPYRLKHPPSQLPLQSCPTPLPTSPPSPIAIPSSFPIESPLISTPTSPTPLTEPTSDQPLLPATSHPPSTPTTSPNNSTSPSNPPLTRPQRTRRPNPRYFNPNLVNHTTIHPIPPAIEPTCVSQAVKDPLWRSAMSKEFTALLANGTWELVPKAS